MYNARNPKWTSSNKTTIILEIELNGEWVAFVASPNDCTDYGPKLFENAINGEYGEVALSDEELILTGKMSVPEGMAITNGKLINLAYYEQQATEELNRRLAPYFLPEALDDAENNEAYAAERKEKIAALRAVKSQSGWPVNIQWP